MRSDLDDVLRLDRENRIANRAGEMLRDCLLKHMGVRPGTGADLWTTAKIEAAEAIDKADRALDRKHVRT